MVNWYYEKITVTYNGEQIGHNRSCDYLAYDNSEEIKDKTVILSWNDIAENINRYWDISLFGKLYDCPISKCKKGYKLNYRDTQDKLKTLKSWTAPETNFIMTKTYHKAKFNTINDILKYRDSDLAIQYLVERGLSIVNNGGKI